jgi:hypothetical protein
MLTPTLTPVILSTIWVVRAALHGSVAGRNRALELIQKVNRVIGRPAVGTLLAEVARFFGLAGNGPRQNDFHLQSVFF